MGFKFWFVGCFYIINVKVTDTHNVCFYFIWKKWEKWLLHIKYFFTHAEKYAICISNETRANKQTQHIPDYYLTFCL